MMTYEEWKQKRETEKIISEYLKNSRQVKFTNEQSKESVFTRPIESIVDVDN